MEITGKLAAAVCAKSKKKHKASLRKQIFAKKANAMLKGVRFVKNAYIDPSEAEEERKQDIHEQKLRFDEEKHQLDMEKERLNLFMQRKQLELKNQQMEEGFALKQQMEQQKNEEANAVQVEQNEIKRQEMLMKQQMQQQQMQQKQMEAQQKQMMSQQQGQEGMGPPQPRMTQADYRNNMMGGAQQKMGSLDLSQYTGFLDSPILPTAAGGAMGLGAANIMFPNELTRGLRDAAADIKDNPELRKRLLARSVGTNWRRSLLGLGAGGAVGLGAHYLFN